MITRIILICVLIHLCCCGTYIGSEKVSYNPNTMIGFRTQKTEDKRISDLDKAYLAGKADAPKPIVEPVDDGSVTILNKKEVSEIGGGLVDTAVTFAGPFGFLLLIGIGLLKRSRA